MELRGVLICLAAVSLSQQPGTGHAARLHEPCNHITPPHRHVACTYQGTAKAPLTPCCAQTPAMHAVTHVTCGVASACQVEEDGAEPDALGQPQKPRAHPPSNALHVRVP